MKALRQLLAAAVVCAAAAPALAAGKADKVIETIHKVNRHWQQTHTEPGTAFWHNAAYHTGNMEAWKLTGEKDYYDYSVKWAEHNQWAGARGTDRSKWKYSYGETDDYVLFGDWQVCFQTYADLYTAQPDPKKIARAREVMEHITFYPPMKHCYPASICGKACDTAGYCHLEKKGVLKRKFRTPFRKREAWKLPLLPEPK